MFRTKPTDEAIWHKWHVFLPIRTIDGRLAMMDVWRKRGSDGWLYQRRQMSEQEISDLTTY
jgi:hypothetical protein